ncbi:hypothetical protein [Paenibacillus eucommiae]|uniref:Uncharacterized protein n=1 Tax=Paenibacillus eucommiae TaxID=1355755 RepID=A0ABS4ILU9_9BACL|nr:hypothetical protein [Paenibacillus eucommiae]MBP1988539.1 hypothetical protein [Paenibacillus eucommiae]
MTMGNYPAKVQYILRPGYQMVRDDELWNPFMAYAKAIRADAIMPFNLHIEANHPDLQSLRERLPIFAKRFAEVREAGMSPQINYYTTIGHGQLLPEPHAEKFTTIMDGYGNRPTGCPCPLCPDFRSYMREAYALFAGLDIDAMWIDDDFRLAGRSGTETFQCFCELHMQAFEERTGQAYSKEKIMELLLKSPQTCTEAEIALRSNWRTFQEEGLAGLASEIREACFAVNPAVVMGIMTNSIESVLHNARDLNAEIRALRTPKQAEPWVRVGGAAYTDDNLLDLLSRVHSFDILASMISEPCRLSSEIENFPWTIGGKSARGLNLELYLLTATIGGHLTLSINDTFFGFDDVSGNIQKTLGPLKHYLQAVTDAVHGKSRRGASIPFPSQPEVTARYDLNKIPGFSFNAQLSQIGIPLAPSDTSPALISLREASAFAEEEIQSWLNKGAVLTSEAYYHLREHRGMLQDCPIRVEKGEEIPQTYLVFEKVHTPRAPKWLKDKDMVNWVWIPVHTEYQIIADDGAEAWSGLYDNLGTRRNAGVVVSEHPYRIAVVAHEGSMLKETGLQWLYQQILAFVSGGEYPAMVELGVNMYPVWWEQDNQAKEAILGLTNFSLETYPSLDLWIPTGRKLAGLDILSREGVWNEAEYSAAEHPNGGIRLTLQGSSVPDHVSFETFRVKFV